jgi:8-oxo-dGTP pyrophosphatase MutT (NUDIX family)
MYKVFFNDRKIILTDNFTKHFLVKYGLFYKFRDQEDLMELISLYQKLSRIENLYIFHTDIEELRKVFKQCFIPIDAAGGLVKNSRGEFLLIYRRGKWDLPKGKLNKKESFDHAAIREVEEECGITNVQIESPLISTYHTYSYKDGIALKKTTWFEMLYNGDGEVTPQKEEDITEVKWIPKSQLAPYLEKSFPAIRDVFTYFGI